MLARAGIEGAVDLGGAVAQIVAQRGELAVGEDRRVELEQVALTLVLGQDVAEIAETGRQRHHRSEEHTSELQSLMRISYAVFCLKKKKEHKSKSTNTRSCK